MLLANDATGTTAPTQNQPSPSPVPPGSPWEALAQKLNVQTSTLFVVGGIVVAVALSGTSFAPVIVALLAAGIVVQLLGVFGK